jgi:integrase
MALEKAREQTRKARGMAREGRDPRAEDPVKSDSFKAMVGDYIQHVQIGELENRSARETEAVILNNTKDWHTRPIATIRPDEIEKLLWRVRDGDEKAQLNARPYLANRLHAHLRHLFEWVARPSGPLKESPLARMKKPWRKEKPRQRDWFKGKPGDAAIKALWSAAEEIGGDGERYVKMMILTGKRKTALADMRWEEIDDDWYWDAPPSQSKNKRLHGVPLPGLAHGILHPRRASGRVFEELRLGTLLNQVRKASGIDDFFWHGLRHLAETKCAELRDAKDNERPAILPHVRDLLFDHATARGSGRGYDHHDYKFEMREAVEAWAAHVEELTTPKGVARLR